MKTLRTVRLSHRLLSVAALTLAFLLAACGGGASSQSGHQTLVLTGQYQGKSSDQFVAWLKTAGKAFEKTHPNVTVKLNNIVTSDESTYYAKLDLLERSASTSPDVTYEDSFLVKSDAQAGYIRPLPQLKSFSEWKDQYSVFHDMTEYNGQPYAMMVETDVQQLYYDTNLLQKAGISGPWQPKNFNDIITAAKAIKASDPGVIPFWIYTGTPLGEASSFRGFEVLLDGTSQRLYDQKTSKWETGGPGFNQVFQFLQTLHQDGLEENASEWSSPSAGTVLDQQLMPAQKVGIALDGSWVSTGWLPNGATPWAAGVTTYQVAQVPTSNGQGVGVTNQSGGWSLAVPAKSAHSSLAVQFIEQATNPGLLANYDGETGQLPVEANVANDPTFKNLIKSDPLFQQATTYVAHSNYRPGFGPYNQLSADLAAITGQISLGQLTASQAAAQYASDVKKLAGTGHYESNS